MNILCEVHIIIVTVLSICVIINGSLHSDQDGCLPRIQFADSVVFKARSGESLGIESFDTLNELRREFSFSRGPKRVIQGFVPISRLLRGNGIVVGKVTQNGLQEIALGIEFQQVAVETFATQIIVQLGRPQQIWRFQGDAAEFGYFGPTLGCLRIGIFGGKQIGRLFVRFNGQDNVGFFVTIHFFRFVQFGAFFTELGSLHDATSVCHEENGSVEGLHGLFGVGFFEIGSCSTFVAGEYTNELERK
jgi:hypothetical protein